MREMRFSFAIFFFLGNNLHEIESFAPATTFPSLASTNVPTKRIHNVPRPKYFAASIEQMVETDEAFMTSGLTPEQEDFFQSLDVKTYGAPFLARCRDLQMYKNENGGSCYVPKRYTKNPTLGNWVNKTRQMYRKFQEGKSSSITQDRIDLLNELGFVWSLAEKNAVLKNASSSKLSASDENLNLMHSKDITWMNTYNQMKEYLKLHKVTTAPPSSNLGVWAARQRREYQCFKLKEKSSMTLERIQLLNDIDFDWSPRDTKWNMRIQELLDYKRRFGDCCVPVQWKENPPLGRWVSTQRKYYKLYLSGKPTRISKERIIQLTKLGFVWNRWEDAWNDDSCKVDACEDLLKRL